MENISKNHKSLRNDRYNTETPQEIRQYEQEQKREDEDKESFSGADYSAVYDNGKAYLLKRGFLFKPVQGGKYCDHDIYKLVSIPSHYSNGYSPDESVEVFVPITKDDFRKFKDALIDFIDQYHSPKIAGKFWNVVYSPTTKKDKPIYAFSKIEHEHETEKEHNGEIYTGISLTGSTYNPEYNPTLKWLPQKEWFDTRIQQVELKDLITILPEAEMKMLALCIGRALIGENNSVTSDRVDIKHTFRTMPIMVGKTAGLGKSTLMEYLISAMQECGYQVAALTSKDARFGWGKIIRSDLAYCDDLTPASQKRVITSENTKSIISANKINTERKGVDSVMTKARCVMIANSNDYSRSDFYKMDSGMKSRIKLLATHSGSGLKKALRKVEGVSEGTPSLKTEEHWTYLAKKLDTSEKVLALWLMRLCADLFMDSIGLSISVENHKVAHPMADMMPETKTVIPVYEDRAGMKESNKLYKTISELSFDLKIKVTHNPTEDFIKFMRWCWVNSTKFDDLRKAGFAQGDDDLSVGKLKSFVQILRKCVDVYSPSVYKKMLKMRRQYSLTEFHPFDFFINICVSEDGLNVVDSEILRTRGLLMCRPDIFKSVIGLISDREGFKLTSSYSHLAGIWEASKNDDDEYREMFEELLDVGFVNSLIDASLSWE